MGLLYKGGLEVLQRDAVWWQSLSRHLAELLPVTGWGGKTPHRSSYLALTAPPANVTEGSELSPWEGLDSPSWILVDAAAAAESLQSCPTLCDPIDEKHSFSPFRELWRTLMPHTPVGTGASLRGTNQTTSAGATRNLPCSELSLTVRLFIFKKGGFRHFPGGPVDKSLSFQCRRTGFDP